MFQLLEKALYLLSQLFYMSMNKWGPPVWMFLHTLAEKIKEDSKIFKWFNCLAYSTLSALLARIIIFPAGALSEVDYFIRFIVIFTCIIIFLISKKNFVYPTVLSALLLFFLNSSF